MRWLDSNTNSMDMNLSKLREIEKPGMLQSMGSQRIGHDLVTEQQHDPCDTGDSPVPTTTYRRDWYIVYVQ